MLLSLLLLLSTSCTATDARGPTTVDGAHTGGDGSDGGSDNGSGDGGSDNGSGDGGTGDGGSDSGGAPQGLQRPHVFSYSYPWGSDTNPNSGYTDPDFMDFGAVRLSSANMVDNVDVDAFVDGWKTDANAILARTGAATAGQDAQALADTWGAAIDADRFNGMSLDELVGADVDAAGVALYAEAFALLREARPNALIHVWTDSGLGRRSLHGDLHAPLLQAFVDAGVYVSPELYYRESAQPDFATADAPFALFTEMVTDWEAQAPGITPLILIGLGTVQNVEGGYDDVESIDYGDFLVAQIELCATDPVLSETAGLALYAPGYLYPDTLTRVDDAILASW